MSDSPSIRTRSRTRLSGTPPAVDLLPSPRPRRKLTKPVSPPLSSTRLSTLIYILALLTSLLALYYSYRLTQWKSDVGGWWNLALGTPGGVHSGGAESHNNWSWRGRSGRKESEQSGTVEDRINALALALGMPSKELASAIAIAVRDHVPPASLSSIAAKETGSVVDALVKGAQDPQVEDVDAASKSEDDSSPGGFERIVKSFVAMDEP